MWLVVVVVLKILCLLFTVSPAVNGGGHVLRHFMFSVKDNQVFVLLSSLVQRLGTVKGETAHLSVGGPSVQAGQQCSQPGLSLDKD